MQVETFEIEGNISLATEMAQDSEAIELINSLGLAGQLQLVNPETATRNPYRLITNEESAIYGTIFPIRTRLPEYSDGIIPLRVLQVAAHAKETGFFKDFYVWHPSAGQKDPILVGHHESPQNGWTRTEVYLLARWGEALLTLDELRVKARAILVANWTSKLTKIKGQVENGLNTVESTADAMLLGQETKSDPYFNW